MENTELTHHGILGMKWGHRRYQNKDGSLTEEGKKRYGDGDGEGDSKETYEDKKAKAIKSGSAKDVLRFQGDLTQQEMQFAIARIKWEKEMKSIEASETVTGKDRVDKFFDGVKTATGYAGKAIQAYNTVANIVNAFSKSEVDLPKISTNLSNDNKETRTKQMDELKKKAKEMADDYDKAAEKQQKKEDKKAADDLEKLKKESEKQAKKEDISEPKSEPKSESKSESKTYVDAVVEERTYDSNRKEVNVSSPKINVNESVRGPSESKSSNSDVEVKPGYTATSWARAQLESSVGRTPVSNVKVDVTPGGGATSEAILRLENSVGRLPYSEIDD